MAEPVGSRPGGDDGEVARTDPWPSRPTAPPSAPPVPAGFADAPTEPELPRTLEGGPPPTQETPFFHDLSGGSGPFGPAPDAGAIVPMGSPYGATGYPPPPYGYAGTPYGPYAYGGWAPPRNNGLAVASMICGILAFAFCQLLAIPALILGLRARRQIRDSQGAETGDAFALAGIILSAVALVLLVAVVGIYALAIGLAVSSGV